MQEDERLQLLLDRHAAERADVPPLRRLRELGPRVRHEWRLGGHTAGVHVPDRRPRRVLGHQPATGVPGRLEPADSRLLQPAPVPAVRPGSAAGRGGGGEVQSPELPVDRVAPLDAQAPPARVVRARGAAAAFVLAGAIRRLSGGQPRRVCAGPVRERPVVRRQDESAGRDPLQVRVLCTGCACRLWSVPRSEEARAGVERRSEDRGAVPARSWRRTAGA